MPRNMTNVVIEVFFRYVNHNTQHFVSEEMNGVEAAQQKELFWVWNVPLPIDPQSRQVWIRSFKKQAWKRFHGLVRSQKMEEAMPFLGSMKAFFIELERSVIQ